MRCWISENFEHVKVPWWNFRVLANIFTFFEDSLIATLVFEILEGYTFIEYLIVRLQFGENTAQVDQVWLFDMLFWLIVPFSSFIILIMIELQQIILIDRVQLLWMRGTCILGIFSLRVVLHAPSTSFFDVKLILSPVKILLTHWFWETNWVFQSKSDHFLAANHENVKFMTFWIVTILDVLANT